MPFSTSNSQAPFSAQDEWSLSRILKDAQGYAKWLQSHPDLAAIASTLIAGLRLQYPHAFPSDVTVPPSVIRGTDSQTEKGQQIIGFDYIRVTGSTNRLQQLRDRLQHFYPALEFQASSGRYSYALGERSDLGIQINYTPHEHEGGLNHGKATLDISGAALAALTRENVMRLTAELDLMCFLPSRLDIKIRDFDNLITPFELDKLRQKSTDKGVEVSGFKKGNFVSSPTNIGEKAVDGTLYLGRRESPKFLRAYSAKEKHGIDATDWELELKNDKAKSAWRLIVDEWHESNNVEETYKLMASILTSSVNFVHRTDKNLERCEAYSFWSQMKQGLDTVKLATVKAVTTLEKSKKWLRKSVSKTLATVVFNGLGVTVSELKEKGFDSVLHEREAAIKDFLLGIISEVELKTTHIDRLSAAESRQQATGYFSPLFQT